MTIRLLQGDALTVLRTLPAESVHCCVTSPPYFGLRSYLPDGHPDKHLELGSERTPAEFIARHVEVFREVRRVLRSDGTCFVNLGDSYAHSLRQTGTAGAKQNTNKGSIRLGSRRLEEGLKEKDLLMMPFRLALALQADGWWLRSVMPWVKRSCMPESCTDRPTSAIEYVFLLAKRPRYFWDAEAVRQRGEIPAGTLAAKGSAERAKHANGRPPEYAVYSGQRNFRNSDLFFASLEDAPAGPAPYRGKSQKNHDAHGVQSASDVKRRTLAAMAARGVDGNKVAEAPEPFGLMLDENGEPLALDVNPEAFPGAHFATFPTRLVEPLIKAGTSERGCCPACGAPWARDVRDSEAYQEFKLRERTRKGGSMRANDLASLGLTRGTGNKSVSADRVTATWRQTCACPPADPVPCTVLDPFSGSGTTALVADRLQRHAIGIDLHHTYQEMAVGRFEADAPLFAEVER